QFLSTSNSVSISLPDSPLQAGTYTIAAQYTAGASDVSPSSTATALSNKVHRTTTLESSQDPTRATGTPSITATVTSSTGATPDGSVQFSVTRPDGSTINTLQSLSTSNSVSISLPESPLQAGTYTVAAQYIAGPSDVFASSTATALSEVVNKVPTTTTLTSSQNPTLTTGTPSITATVTSSTGATPDGSVQFTLTRPDGSTINTLQSLSTSNSVSISLPESPLQAGTYTVAAQYIAGPSDVFASSTATFYELVNDPTAIATNTHLVASPSVVTAAQTISFTATVSRVGTGTSIPTGTVSFVENGTIIGTATL